MNEQDIFFQAVYHELEQAFASDPVELKAVEVPKNNCIEHGITMNYKGAPCAVVAYPNHFYKEWKQGRELQEIVEDIKHTFRIGIPNEIQSLAEMDISRQNAGEHLRAVLVNYEKNKAWLKDIPHRRVQDLAVYAKWDLGEGFSTKMNSQLLSHIQLTKEEALNIAQANTRKSAKLSRMDDVMLEIVKKECGNDERLLEDIKAGMLDSPLLVLSNKSGVEGAALMTDMALLKKIHKELDEDFYILPSSVHEVLLLPKSEVAGQDPGELREMVSTINETEVLPKDCLSNQVYEFDGHRLTIAGEHDLQLDSAEINEPKLEEAELIGIGHRR